MLRQTLQTAVSLALLASLCIVRPHLTLFNPVGFAFLVSCLLFAILLSATEVRTLARGLAVNEAWVLAATFAALNLFFLVSQKIPWGSSTDTMMALHAARHALDGLVPVPGFWYLPDLSDFSRDASLWVYSWSVLTVLLPMPFLLLFDNPFHGLHLLMYLLVFLGVAGWMRVAKQMRLPAWVQLLFGSLLVLHVHVERMFNFYVGDIYPYAAAPWIFYSVLRATGNFHTDPLSVRPVKFLIPAFLSGLLFFIKFSSVFSGIGNFLLLSAWLIFGEQNQYRPLDSRRLQRLAMLCAAFLAPIAVVAIISLIFTGVADVSSTWHREAQYWSHTNWQRLVAVIVMPADLFVVTGHFFMRPVSAVSWIYCLFIYAGAALLPTRLRLPSWWLLFCTITIPSLGLMYASIQANQDAMFVGRYRFAFAPMAFLIPMLPLSIGFGHGSWRNALGAAGMAMVLFASFLPGIETVVSDLANTAQAPVQEAWAKDPRQLRSQSSFLGNEALQTIEWLNQNRSADSVLFTVFEDRAYESLYLLRGKTIALYLDQARLNAVMSPHYTRSGIGRESIADFTWKASQPIDVYLLVSNPLLAKELELKAFKDRFPQILKWELMDLGGPFQILNGRVQP
jgi:hypothetical protein